MPFADNCIYCYPVQEENYLNKELKNAVEAADAKAQYDECAKRLLGQNSILSYIFAHTIEAFQGMKPKEIIPYIEGAPYIGEVPAEPGLTNIAREQNGQRVTGLNTENRYLRDMKFLIYIYKISYHETIKKYAKIPKIHGKSYHIANNKKCMEN